MNKKYFFTGIMSLALLIPTVNFATDSLTHTPSHHEKLEPKKIININQADAQTLGLLRDIGPKKAADIIAYRNKNGPFKSVQGLIKVKGISTRIVSDNKGHITV